MALLTPLGRLLSSRLLVRPFCAVSFADGARSMSSGAAAVSSGLLIQPDIIHGEADLQKSNDTWRAAKSVSPWTSYNASHSDYRIIAEAHARLEVHG